MVVGPKERIAAPPRLVATLSQSMPVGQQAPSAVKLLLCEIIIKVRYHLLLSEAAALKKQKALDEPIFKLQMSKAVSSALVLMGRRAE